jgi:predicted nucleic acid-binding protein
LSVLYADTSALAKVYVEEAGTRRMRERAVVSEAVASSVLAWPEALAMLARRRREGLLTAAEHDALRARFHADWLAIVAVDLDGRVLELVDQLVRDHPLRSADAVHLASALFLQESGLVVEFACCDHTLIAAARRERLPVFDPAD